MFFIFLAIFYFTVAVCYNQLSLQNCQPKNYGVGGPSGRYSWKSKDCVKWGGGWDQEEVKWTDSKDSGKRQCPVQE